MKIPRILCRKAVKRFFNKVACQKWDYWFRHEKENGLHELRVPGPFERAYYSGEGIKEWLLSEGVYGPDDFEVPHISSSWSGLSVRKHALAS